MIRVLVTGGAGFVGRHLIKRLLDNKYSVVCVDPIVPLTGGLLPEKWPLFNPYDYDNFEFIKEDSNEYFNSHAEYFDYVFHLAAMVGGRLMIENNPLVVGKDLSIDATLWEWATKAKPGKIVYFSSSAAYPISYQRKDGYVLLTEDMISFEENIGMPDLSYGWAKLTGEYLAKLAYEKYGIKSVIYRPFSGYGEDQDLSYPFPSIIKRVIENNKSIKLNVWGSGNQMRDFIYIEDCVDGILLMMDKIDNAKPVNLSTGIFTSFKNLTKFAANLYGYNPDVEGLSDKPEGVFARGGDIKLQNDKGFTYSTKIEEGIKRSLSYYENIR